MSYPFEEYQPPMEQNQPPVQPQSQPQPPQKKSKKKKVLFTILSVAIAISCFLTGMLATWLALDKEIRSLIKLKASIQGLYYEEVTDEEFYNTVFEAINGGLLDSYSEYLTEEEYAEMQLAGMGNQSGLGVVISAQAADGTPQIRIVRVCGNSPAEAAGIKDGDMILGFGNAEGQITESNSFEEMSVFLSGKAAGEDLWLKIQSGGEVKTLKIQKQAYVENYVFYRTSTAAYRFSGEEATVLTEGGSLLASLPTDTAYIRLTQFNGNATEQFDGAMNLFREQGKKNLVLDLRDNGGGYLDIMQDIASYFCKTATDDEPVCAIADYGDYTQSFAATENVYNEYFSSDSRICVLADDGTASASEALMGCMLDYGAIDYDDICLIDRGGVAKTYGKGIMQTTFPLGILNPDAVKLTTARICWPVSNTCIHDRGIVKADGTHSTVESYIYDVEVTNCISALFN